MSIIFGIRKAEGQAVEERQLLHLAHATDRYAPDGTFVHANGRVGMGFQPYHTHQRSNIESQPVVDGRGDVLVMDGRLDNHAELCGHLDIREADTADSLIVLAAFERWGEDCFSRFIGEWALALWSHADRSLYLARDHAGTRTLYFEQTKDQILWSTFLETFFDEQKARDLDERFAVCYLGCQLIGHLTPYKGVRAVPPAHYLKFHEGQVVRKPHWQWQAKDKIRYHTDLEYEEHFLSLFQQSVERHTAPGAPILAQLSGGMDSTAIVCMSDHIRNSQGATPEDLLDTISYYNDTEPNWDEKPYFTAVEQQRGKKGVHIDASLFGPTFQPPDTTYLLPGPDSGTNQREAYWMHAAGLPRYRTILSGIGGDEVLGGVPTPMPELADRLVSGDLRGLIHASISWSLVNRSPLIYMLADTMRFTIDVYRNDGARAGAMPPWVTARSSTPLTSSSQIQSAMREHGFAFPSSLVNGRMWWSMIESLPTLSPAQQMRPEYRYPYLDKSLVEFLFRIPPRQLVEPGKRRSLMRRALHGMLPKEVIYRRRKAYSLRQPLLAVIQNQERICALLHNSIVADLHFIDPHGCKRWLDTIGNGKDLRWLPYLGRLIALELWLRSRSIHVPGDRIES
jgi:asparagine synthase (glutamine-hydrolysing)